MLFNSIPLKVAADTINYVDLPFKVNTDKGSILKGEKGIDYDISSIDVSFDQYFSPVLEKANDIKIIAYVNGAGVSENEKFDIDMINGNIIFALKNDPTTQAYYKLRKHTLYNIYIPEGALKNSNGKMNKELNYTFVTKGDGTYKGEEVSYKDDIMVNAKPYNKEKWVNKENNEIVFEFVDDIEFEEDFLQNKAKYISIVWEKMGDYERKEDYIGNYNISISKNKLIIASKSTALKDMVKYTIKLQNNAVYLKNSKDVKIYNQEQTNKDFEQIAFYTDNMLKRTSPINNQENVEVEPTIEFEFKYPVEIIDKNKVKISSDGLKFSLDEDDIYLSTKPGEDDTTLVLNVDDSVKESVYPLYRNTVYKVTIEEGAVAFKDFWNNVDLEDIDDPEDVLIKNKEINLYFITSPEGEMPVPTAYSSSLNQEDDIRYLDYNDVVLPEDKVTNLDPKGSIYIKFDRAIKADKQSDLSSLVGGINIYKMIKPKEEDYDETGTIYDKNVQYYKENNIIIPSNIPKADIEEVISNSEKTDEEKDLQIHSMFEDKTDYMKKMPVGKVEIVNTDTLKITPLYPLDYLGKYKVTVDKELIEDSNGYNMNKDIDLNFWVKPSETKIEGNWKDPKDNTAEGIKDNTQGPYHGTYEKVGATSIISGTSNSEKITLDVDSEVIANVKDKAYRQTPIDSKNLKKVTYDALNDISLVDGYNTDEALNKIEISKFEFQYYFENDVKKTKIYVYPKNKLDSGKYYKLSIPFGTLVTKSRDSIPSLEVNFVVEGNYQEGDGAYQIKDNQPVVTDFWQKGEWICTVNGYNFKQNLKQVTLTPESGRVFDTKPAIPPIVIDKDDIEFRSLTELRFKIRDENAQKFSKEEYTGRYIVEIAYDDNTKIQMPTPLYFSLLSKGKPKVLEKNPDSSNGTIYNEKGLPHDIQDDVTKDRQFLKLTFEDIDGKLEFNYEEGINKLLDSSIKVAGSNNVLDKDFLYIVNGSKEYIDKYTLVKDRINKKAYLYIPVKDISSQSTYNVSINSGVVKNDSLELYNDVITWSFTTMNIPDVIDEGILIKTVGEEYDEDEPLIIYGDFFNDSTKVYFNDIAAESVWFASDASGKKYLQVYLPKNRLSPGLYNIIIKNDDTHTKTLYGALSVVKKGDYVPNENYKVKDDTSKGEVRSEIKISEDTLMLKSKYTDKSKIEFDLDELMGADVLVRNIKYDPDKNDVIGELITKSKWADITIYGLKLDDSSDDDEVNVQLGRLEPTVAQSIQKKLRSSALKSEFIQVTGENYEVSSITVLIPYDNSDGKNLKALRYDEDMRSWYTENVSVDIINKKASIFSSKKGIFVLTE